MDRINGADICNMSKACVILVSSIPKSSNCRKNLKNNVNRRDRQTMLTVPIVQKLSMTQKLV